MNQQSRSATFRWFVFLAAFLILPNLPLPLAGRPLNLLVSETIDLDYLLVAMVALFLPRAAAFVLLLLAMFGDFIHAACATYLFSPSEFIDSMRFGGMVSTLRAVSIIWALALVLLISVLTALSVPRSGNASQRRAVASALFGFVVVLMAIQIIGSRGRAFSIGSRAFLRIPSVSLIRGQWTYERYQRGERLANMHAMPSASAIALGHLRDAVPQRAGASLPNFVQILVESWGQPKDDSLRNAMLVPYSDGRLLSRYRVLEGTMPFEGPTTSGEARELCETHVGFNASHGSVEQMQHCLPMRMRAMGYRAMGVHGFQGAMFDRKIWFPQIGFQDIWFEEQFHAMGLPECPGPFGGTCDASIALWLSQRLMQPNQPPLFVHWVTLNSHLPVPVPAPLKDPASCAISSATRSDESLCSWYQLVNVVHRSVLEMALAPMNRPTIFVIVGDHAPPFDRQAERTEFSSTEVPYVILLPKPLSGPTLFGN